MELRVPRLPFSLDPLIAEAKRRANRRRLLLASLLVVLVGPAAATAFGLRSPPSQRLTLPPRHRLGIERIPGMTRIKNQFIPGPSSCPNGHRKAVLPGHFAPIRTSFCGSRWFSGLFEQVWVPSAAVAAEGVTRLRRRVPGWGAAGPPPSMERPRRGPVEVQVTVLNLLSWPQVKQRRIREAKQIVPTGYSERGGRATFTPLPQWAINGGVARQIDSKFNEGLNRFQFIWAAGTHIVMVAVYGGKGGRLPLQEAQHVAALAGPFQ
jgi:hypothetical protein